MSKMIADLDSRIKALSAGDSFIVQAPAGSGKTGLLIQRYLKLLSLVDAPEEIVAISFTRKAAAEMQSRILEALSNVINQKQPGSEHEKLTYQLAQAALLRDKEKGWKINDNPSRLRLQTIDSLCASLSKQMPVLAKLGTQLETLEYAETLYQQAAVNTLAELESGKGWSDDIAKLVYYLDNDLPRIKKLLVEMMKKRDQWLPHVVIQHEREDMEQALVCLIEEQLKYVANKFPKALEPILIELIQFAAENLRETAPDNEIVAALTLESIPACKAEALKYWFAISKLLLTESDVWRKTVNLNTGFPAPSKNKLKAETYANKKKEFQELIANLQEVEGLQSSMAKIKSLPSKKYADSEWQIINALCQLLLLATAELRLVFAEHNQIDFIGVSLSAIEALGGEEEPTELALTLDYNIKHLLVDEFQDISISQYQLLQRLTSEWSVDDGRSLFLVGDPMQSIYRFRQADVSLFMQTFHQQALGAISLQALKLTVNFRSQKKLIDWVNRSFKTIFPSQNDLINSAVAYTDAIAFNDADSDDNVMVYPQYTNSYETEAEVLLQRILDIREEYPEDSLAILVRSRTHLNKILPVLRKEKLLFQAIDIEAMGTESAIQDLLALTRCYLYPADSIAWLACLRAPWCGLTLESLLIIVDKNKEKTIWEQLCDESRLSRLNKAEQQRVMKFKTVYSSLLVERQRLSLRQTIESFWIQLGGPATLMSKTDLDNCETYFTLLGNMEKGGDIPDLKVLFDNVTRLFAAPDLDADKRLQVMTIHKAKGLEFDHVILPGLGRSARVQESELLVWLLRQRNGYQQDLILAPIREPGQMQAPIYDFINNIDKTKQRHEDARLLYVAATRARKSLNLFGHCLLKEKGEELICQAQGRSLLEHLWPSVKTIFAQHKPATVDNRDEVPVVINPENRRLTSNWKAPEIKTEFSWQQTEDKPSNMTGEPIQFEWASETARHVGTVVHMAIQMIAEQGLKKWTKTRIQAEKLTFDKVLKQLAVSDTERPAAVLRILKALENSVSDERGRWILSQEHDEQRNEYAITGMVDNKLSNVILDRTFIDKQKTRWIIDYKTSRHESGDIEVFLDREQQRYRAQLEKYGVLMRQFGEQKIKFGLYFPLLNGWREWSLE